jgi:hypothetical protein
MDQQMKYKTIIFNSLAFVILTLVITGIVFIKTRTKISYIHNVVTPVSLPQLLKWTDIIIIGTVTDTDSLKVPASIPSRNRIMTDATIKVDEYVFNRHGNTPSEVIVRYEGGVFGNEQVIIDESDELLEGEHVLLFLTERNDGLFDLAAARFAKYTIQHGRLGLLILIKID